MQPPDGSGTSGQPRRIGEILVADGKVTEEQVSEALKIQKTDPRNLGKILVSLGYLSEEDLAVALSMRLNVEYVALFEVEVDPEVLGIIEEDVLIQHNAVPLRIEQGRLIVAMTDPNDLFARSDLTISAGHPITPVIAAEDAVRELHARLFSNDTAPDDAVIEASEPEPLPVGNGFQPAAAGASRDGVARPASRAPRKKRRKLGEILLLSGGITREQLDQALHVQEHDPRGLGAILVSLGYVSGPEMAAALGRRLKIGYVVLSELKEGEFDEATLKMFEEDIMRKYSVLPLRVEQGRLIVAMTNPNDLFALEDLRIIAKMPITPVVVTEEDLEGAFAVFFGAADEPVTLAGQRLDGEPTAQPADDGAPSSGGKEVHRTGEPGGEGSDAALKVLIAEDDGVSRAIVRRTVERYGHECVVAENGLEAWEIYQRSPEIDVIVSDWMMPVMDGLELCRKVRGLGREKYTFFVFLTSLGSQEHLLEGMRAGADEYLTKPLDREQLRLKLEAASRVRSLHDHLSEERVEEDAGGGEPAPTGDGRAVARAGTRKVGIGGGKVWEILVSQGRISEEQLQRALEVQKTDRRELGKVLVSLGYITDKDLAQAQAQRLRLGFTELTEHDVDRGVVSLVDQKVLRRYGVMPLRLENGRLMVAMSDPTNIYALEDLMMISGYPVTPVVALEEEIQRVQNKIYAMGEEVTEFLEEAGKASIAEDFDEIDLGQVTPDEAPIIRLVSSILQQAVGEGASDIHIEPRSRELTVRMRVDGVLREVMSIPPKLQSGVIARLKIVSNLDIAEKRIPQDGRFSVKLGGQKIDLRVASLPTVFGEKIVLRLLDTSNAEVALTALGFPQKVYEKYERIFRRPYGAILVTGPTGSGKSTTLYATLNELNSPEKNIITVEDPVEYRMRGVNQVQTNPKAGLTFASALKSILRADPDIVMIGEIRDFETAKIAVEAALTGHLVLATLHTNNAPGALSRLTDMGVEPFLTSSAVDCVIAQRLARRLCENCKEPTRLDQSVLDDVKFPMDLVGPEGLNVHKAVGCDRCGGSGYRGRVGVYELMVVGEEIKEMILRRVSTDEIGRAAEKNGMVRLRDDGMLKVAQGLTTMEEVFRSVV